MYMRCLKYSNSQNHRVESWLAGLQGVKIRKLLINVRKVLVKQHEQALVICGTTLCICIYSTIMCSTLRSFQRVDLVIIVLFTIKIKFLKRRRLSCKSRCSIGVQAPVKPTDKLLRQILKVYTFHEVIHSFQQKKFSSGKKSYWSNF